MEQSLKLTGTGFHSVIRNIYHWYFMSVSRRVRHSENTPFLAAWGPHGPGMVCGIILTASTGGQSLDIGGAPNSVYQIREVWESGPSLSPG